MDIAKLEEPLEFEWDKGNIDKNKKHGVDYKEIEEVFFDDAKKTFPDELHSNGETRYRIIGRTKNDRLLFVVFTIRNGKIRVISARDLNRKEVPLYEEAA
jgi:uncharacterized protein